MELDVRGTPDAIDEAWMTRALCDAGICGEATVTAVRYAGDIGTGQTGRNARFGLTWDDPVGRPPSVVAKFPSSDPAARSAAFTNGTYLREFTYYQRIDATVGVRTPAVWAARYDAESPDFVLLMEDLAGSVQGDQLAGLSVDDADLALEQAVALHAPRWGDETIATELGTDLPEAEQVAAVTMIYAATMDGFLARLGDRLDDDVVGLVRALADKVGSWALGTDTPRTVVHMDYRPDNLLFGDEKDAPPLVVVDWQTVNAGLAMNDVAYLIGGSFEPERRAFVERDLVEEYRRRLGAEGIDYDADTAWRDYRHGSLWGVAMTVIATMLAEQTERGDDMLTAMARRHGRHALDLDALSLVR